MSFAIAEVQDFFPGYRATVRLDKNGDAFVIGQRGEKNELSGEHSFRKDPDLSDVKQVVMGHETIWYLRTNGEVWFQGLDYQALAQAKINSPQIEKTHPELYRLKPQKVDVPPMESITGTANRIGGITHDGRLWIWGQHGDFGSDYSTVNGREVLLPAKPRKVTFAQHEQSILEDELGNIWGRGYIDSRGDSTKAPWAKIPFVRDEKIVAVGKGSFLSRRSSDFSKIRVNVWHRGPQDKVEATTVLKKTFTIPLPADDNGQGTFMLEDETVTALIGGKIFDLSLSPEVGTWKERSLPEPVKKLWSGYKKSFYQGMSGDFYASGLNSYGELGFPANFDLPTEVPGLRDIVSLATHGSMSIAVDKNGRAFSWGSGQKLGDNSKNRVVPMIVNVPPLSKIAMGPGSAIGLTKNGEVYQWGDNNCYVPPGFRTFSERLASKLRGKKEPDRAFPVKVSELSEIVHLAIPHGEESAISAMAIDKKGTMWGWRSSDLSNSLELFFPSFRPPFTWKELSKDDRAKFPFGYDGEVTLKSDGTLLVKQGTYKIRTTGVEMKKTSEGIFLFELPPVVMIQQVSVREQKHALALMFNDGRLGLVGNDKYLWLDENVARISSTSLGHLLILKKTGELFLEDWRDRKLAHRFPESEIPHIEEMTSGDGAFFIRKTDGSVRAWGKNDMNQLGFPDSGSATVPRRLKI